MIKEAYCSFEVSKLLKEKGFSENTEHKIWYVVKQFSTGCPWNSCTYKVGDTTREYDSDCCISMPTHQMALKWLRGVHNVFIYIEPFITTSGLQGYKPYCTKIGGEFMWINPLRKYSNTSSDTYEEVVEAALKYSLENLI